MFSSTCSGALSSPAGNLAPQGSQDDVDPGALPVVSQVVNIDASASARPHLPNGPQVHGYQLEETGADAYARQLRYNRRLRAAFAYGEVMRLLGNHQVAELDYTLLSLIAKSLKQAVRWGDIPSGAVLTQMRSLWENCDPAGPLLEALYSAIAVVSDNENSSLDSLSDVRVHVAHVVGATVCAAYQSNGLHDEFPGSAEVIGGLATCVTLDEAKRYFDQTMDPMQLPGEFRRRVGIVRCYLEECLYQPGPPSRCPVEFPQKGALDGIYNPAGFNQVQSGEAQTLSQWFEDMLRHETSGENQFGGML